MIDGDDKLSRRYGELPKEEPRAALDQAILASARRAVAPKSFSQRWAVPVSLAAVLVLALGITLRMQLEEPGIETSLPSSQPAAPPVSNAELPAAKESLAKDRAAGVSADQPRPERKAVPATAEQDTRDQRRDREAAQAKIVQDRAAAAEQGAAEERKAVEKKAKVEQPAADANVAAEPPKPQPKAFTDAVQSPRAVAAPAAPPATPVPAASAPSAPAPAAAAAAPPAERFEAQSAPTAAARQAAPAQLRAKTEKPAVASGLAKEDAKDPLTKELERIAQLRREGRHREADEALEKFRKDNPSYKIPDALWEQVKPR